MQERPRIRRALPHKGLLSTVDRKLSTLFEWAWVELNYRPHAYQAVSIDGPSPAPC
jgi:hypothetical protein